VAAKKTSKPVSISTNMQALFLGTLALLWLGTFGTYLIWATNTYISLGTVLFQTSQAALPVIWFGVALWLVWSKYKTILNRFFYAGFITIITFGLYIAVASIEQTLRFRFFPPHIANFNDNSLWTAFGHEWTVAAISLGVFVTVVASIKYKSRVQPA
jgi:hypothetical protein